MTIVNAIKAWGIKTFAEKSDLNRVSDTLTNTIKTANAARNAANSVKVKLSEYVKLLNNMADNYMSKNHPEGSGHISMNRSEANGVGSSSVAMGSNCAATKDCSVAIGDKCFSTASCAFAEGMYTTASGTASHAEGYSTIASGSFSHAEGGTGASSGGSAPHAIGRCSHAEGAGTTASEETSHAEGYFTTASGKFSHAEGYNTTASAQTSHAEGNRTTASGVSTHAEGEDTKAVGTRSHAEGYLTTASGGYAHAEGFSTTASGDFSHSEGSHTTALGDYSHVEGYDTTAKGKCSHAEGYNTQAVSDYGHVQGRNNILPYSIASSGVKEFDPNTSYSTRQIVKYNGKIYMPILRSGVGTQSTPGSTDDWFEIFTDDNNYAFIIGNGSYVSGGTMERKNPYSNAHTVDWNGNAWFAGDVYVKSTSGAIKDEGSKKLLTEDDVLAILRDKGLIE